MTDKEKFQELRNILPFISKDGKYYELKYYDGENDCCHFMITNRKCIENVSEYEDVCGKYNIELEDTIPTPDQYFIKKVDEKSNTNIIRTVSDRTLISHLKHNKEDSIEAIEKLKDIVKTHSTYKVRKAAYKTCVDIELENVEELKKYIDNPEIEDETKTDEIGIETKKLKPNRTTPLNKEKAVIVYWSLAKRYKEHREMITCGVFMNTWKELFDCDKYNVSNQSKKDIHDMQLAAFAFVKDKLDNKSLEEIEVFRGKFSIYPEREVPVELKELAQSKGVVIRLAENINKHLSGFDVIIKECKNLTFRINDVPYGLSEKGARRLLESLPTVSELKKQEKILIDTIKSDSIKESNKRKAVDKYKAPYATHDFKAFMNKYTIYECTNKQLTNACVNLCRRVGINNLSNEQPIEYKFCVGSGQRKHTLKRVHNRNKANKKVARKRKER